MSDPRYNRYDRHMEAIELERAVKTCRRIQNLAAQRHSVDSKEGLKQLLEHISVALERDGYSTGVDAI